MNQRCLIEFGMKKNLDLDLDQVLGLRFRILLKVPISCVWTFYTPYVKCVKAQKDYFLFLSKLLLYKRNIEL